MYRKGSETSSFWSQALYFPRCVVKGVRTYETKDKCAGKRNRLCAAMRLQFGTMRTWRRGTVRRAAVGNRQSVQRERLGQGELRKGWRAALGSAMQSVRSEKQIFKGFKHIHGRGIPVHRKDRFAGQWSTIWGSLRAHGETFSKYLETFWLSNLGGCHWHLAGRGRNPQHPTTRRMRPTHTTKTPMVLRLRNRVTGKSRK